MCGIKKNPQQTIIHSLFISFGICLLVARVFETVLDGKCSKSWGEKSPLGIPTEAKSIDQLLNLINVIA